LRTPSSCSRRVGCCCAAAATGLSDVPAPATALQC
jgi:hypothetical protein